jgi:hypothetical protein
MGIIPVLLMASRSGGPDLCQRHNCQCPCHKAKWYGASWAVTLMLSAFVWILITLVTWIGGYPYPETLVQVLSDQWDGLCSLLHRIY